MDKIKQPFTLFLIGATGNLSRKKTLKALYELYSKDLLSEKFTLVGNSRKDLTRTQFQEFVKKAVMPKDEKTWKSFAKLIHYVPGDASKKETFEKIKNYHETLEHCGHHLWHISTLPKLYTSVIEGIKSLGLNETSCGWTKIMLEKPFGTDLKSAMKLNKVLTDTFTEEQIYRIDHYLAKETVQNLLVFRFANGIFEHLWSKEHIDHIQITSSEEIGIERRGTFYDTVGEVKDILQNHVLQMLATTLMEEPSSMEADDVREKRQKLLSQLEIMTPTQISKQVAFGQYSKGKVNGNEVNGYHNEHDIPASSQTETAVALKCFVNNERWQGVPIYIRAGKRFAKKYTEISIQFKEPKNKMFEKSSSQETGNILTFRIQPSEGIVIRSKVKTPGIEMKIENVPLQFCYKSEFSTELIDSYEKLIHDAIEGDPTLFARADGVMSSWKFIQPILDYMHTDSFKVDHYKAGTDGPKSFDELIKKDERNWIVPSIEIC